MRLSCLYSDSEDLTRLLGMDEYDRVRAHHQAKENAEKMYDEHYIDNQGADEYNPNQYSAPERFQKRGNYDGDQDRSNY